MSVEIITGGGVVVTGEQDIAFVQLLALRGALKLELLGLRRRGRSAYGIVKQRFGFRGSKQRVLEQLNALVEQVAAERAAHLN